MLSYQELCYTEYSLTRKERYYPVFLNRNPWSIIMYI
jgi:hypothetical protein